MKKVINEAELDLLKDQCLTIIDFMINKESTPSLLLVRNVILENYEKKNLSGFKKYLIKDLYEWSSGLCTEHLEELNTILKYKFGVTIKTLKD